MENFCTAEKIRILMEYLDKSRVISIITHTGPDGDAVGSATALKSVLCAMFPQKAVRAFVPNDCPSFLDWLADGRLETCLADDAEKTGFIMSSDLVVITDLNELRRTDHLADVLRAMPSARFVMIDHHENPEQVGLLFHDSRAASACYLVYRLLLEASLEKFITTDVATALMAGMTTDTGCFSYSHLDSQYYHAAGDLVERGADPVKINRAIYDTQSENRLRLLGHLLKKMVLVCHRNAAYFTFGITEQNHYRFKPGDTEGVVNYPLSISGIYISAFFMEKDGYIKVSLRSQGDSLDVNTMARRYFSGGGHFNAAGGRFSGTIAQAVRTYLDALDALAEDASVSTADTIHRPGTAAASDAGSTTGSTPGQ